MKKVKKGLSIFLVFCLLVGMMPKVYLANEVTVENVIAQLEAIDTLQEMQEARKNFKASGTYSDATAANHELKRAEYEQYLADMHKARTEAAEAYGALSAEDKALINPELAAKLDDKLDTVWNEVSYNVSAGVHDYQYQAVYPSYAYELSNHMASTDGGDHNDIPQTLVLVNTKEHAGPWTPNGPYSFGTNNYEVVYCCDADTGVEDGTLYQRVNIEDGTYYDAEAAAHIRAIVTNSYPYLSMEEMKANLAKAGFPDAEQLTRSDLIAAVQMAIWNYANGGDGAEYKYSRTFDLNENTQWGKGMHDYTNELWDWWSVGKRHLTVNEEAGDRVNALAKYLAGLEGEKANTNQIVINEVKIEGAEPVQAKQGAYNVAIKVLLNNGGTSPQDNIVITVKSDSGTSNQKVELGKTEYDMLIEAKAGDTINVTVTGEQTLPKGAYLYEPQPADTDGDGVATSREVSQVLVGVAEGVTDIEATESVTLTIPEANPDTANLKLQKTDELGEALTGASFDLYFLGEEATYNIGTYPVDENGALVVENLLPGNYELVESVVSEGFLEPEKPIAFSIDEEGTLVLADSADAELVDGVMVVKNYQPSTTPQGSLSIKKVDSVSKEALEGATFTLKGKNFEKTLSTGEDGTLLFSGLEDGEYTLTETDAPAGYVKDTTEWPIKIGIGEGEQREWVQEVANTPAGSLEVTKTDVDTGETLEGAEFRLTNQEGNVVDTLTTDENGKALFKNLPYGEYKLEETKAPEGYIPNKESKTITIKYNRQIEKYEHTNKAIKGSLKVVKTDESGTPLAGSEFTLMAGETFVGKATTNEEGIAEFAGLSYGVEYKVTETKAPEGYALNEENTDTFTITTDGQVVPFEYTNKSITGSVKVVKTDENGTPLAGAEFTLMAGETCVGKATTNEEGIVEFTGLSYGVEYKVTETKVPEGYVLNEENTDTFTITTDGQVVNLSSVNNAITGSLQVTKVDTDSKEPLAGAEFTLTDTEGNVVATKTTDEKGLAVFEGLAYNVEYKITETKAPEGYLLSEEAEDTFTISEHGQKEEFTYENTRENPSLSVEKTADKTQYLPGETVTYTINVTNNGNVDLEGITLDDVFSKNDVAADQQLTVEGYEGAFDLEIGETMIFTSKCVIPEDDSADTTYKNAVTITTGDISVEDEAVIVVDPTYAFTIGKTADKNEATVGETVTYTIVVTNTGKKALTDVRVKDDMIGLDTIIGQLPANESKTLTGEYVVTADDIGELENIATATVEVDGEQITHDASVIVKVSATAEAAVDETPATFDGTPTTLDKVVTWIQNPKTGDTTVNTLLILIVFVLAGSGLYVYRRKYRGN